MMDLDKRIAAFTTLGEILATCNLQPAGIADTPNNSLCHSEKLNKVITVAVYNNPWFTERNVIYATNAIGRTLTREGIINWLRKYEPELMKTRKPVNVGVVMAGNIPLAGFHDFLCVLMTGNRFIGRSSIDDRFLLPSIAEILVDIEPAFKDFFVFTEERMKGFDAVIATGSNNTSRYFEYYFGKYPCIIRRHRSGVAVLTGKENDDDLKALADDVFIHFGLGCRNVAKVFLPSGVSPDYIFRGMEGYRFVADHNKYRNNYDYYKSVFIINGINHYDNGFLMLTSNDSFSSPISVVYYEHYSDLFQLNDRLKTNSGIIQCIVSKSIGIQNSIPPGTAQQPGLSDYADGVDTIKFLLELG
jgi:hypothetical protein